MTLARLLLAGGLLAAALPAQDSLAGRWKDDTITLSLEDQGGGDYSLAIEVLGADLPGAATFDGEALLGSFTSNGEEFFFEARLEPDGALRLETEEDTVYRLERVSPPAASDAASRNPLAVAAQRREAPAPPGEAFGSFRLDLPEGWTGELDVQGGVQLRPPGFAADASEAYAVAYLQGVTDPTSPRAVAAAGMLLGQAAQIAQHESAPFESAGRPAAVHVFKLPRLGRRLNAYLAAVEGGALAVFGSGLDAKIAARDADLRAILDGASIVVPEPGASPEPQSAAEGAEALNVTTAPNAPPFRPGEVSDGAPQSLQWVAHLSGKLLTQMESYSSAGGGFNSKDRMLLYPNGRFEYAGTALVSADVGSSAASGDRSSAPGWWRVLTVNNISYLGLVIEGTGQEIYSQLAMQNGETYLDGRRTFVTVPQ